MPVLVVGGGACGCAAALAARDAGAEVLLIEQDARPLGSTGMSQGLFCAAGSRAQAEAGIDDDADIFFADIMAKSRGLADPVVARAIAVASGPTADWLIDTHALPWTVDRAFRPSYGNTRLRVHGWHGHSGSDMVPLLHARLAEAGVEVMLQARLADVVADTDGRVRGVTVTRPDGTIERIGCEALILASGGFAANREMVAHFIPDVAAARNIGHEGSQGIAMTVGQRLGAALADMGAYQGYAMLTDPQGVSVPPNVLIEGGVIINIEGARFTDEMADIAGMVHPVLAQPGGHCWVIYDAAIEARCLHIPEVVALAELGAVRTGDTVAELAARTGIPAAALSTTLDAAVTACRGGTPDNQGRSWDGDRPPSAPFRALKVVGAIYHTQGGLRIDGEARALRADGSALPNLFAGGGAAGSVSGPAHWGYLPAMGLCTALTLGRIAGTTAARQVTSGGTPPAAHPRA